MRNVKHLEIDYKKRQTYWIKKHNIKIGSYVQVKKLPIPKSILETNESYYLYLYKFLIRFIIGNIYQVLGFTSSGILLKHGHGKYTVPFFLLRPIKNEQNE